MNRRTVVISVVIAASILASCDDTTAPLSSESFLPGWLDVRLTAAPENSDALLFQIVGGPVDSVSSQNYTVFSNAPAPDQLRVLLVGKLAKDVVARVWVPDPSAVGQYHAVLEQAATGQGFEQQSASGYSLKVEAAARR